MDQVNNTRRPNAKINPMVHVTNVTNNTFSTVSAIPTWLFFFQYLSMDFRRSEASRVLREANGSSTRSSFADKGKMSCFCRSCPIVNPRGSSFGTPGKFVESKSNQIRREMTSLSSSLIWAASIGFIVLLLWYWYFQSRENSQDKDNAIVLAIGLFMLSIFFGTIVVNWVIFKMFR